MEWRESLKTLEQQFSTKAGQSRGLHHYFVEVGDHERDRAKGPASLASCLDQQSGPDEYHPWQMVGGAGLPWVHPRFREYSSTNADANIPENRLVRDGNGIPRAVFEPMSLRFGYFCGDYRVQSGFKSLATAAARILSAASDLADHPFAEDLIDLFRPPRSGVRYVFGDIVDPPDHFIAQSWQAGTLVYPDGVLIDLPLAERSPEDASWVLLLHRLGWRHIPGSPLRCDRMAWHDYHSVPFEWVKYPTLLPNLPAERASLIKGMSPTSYYSVLGDQNHPLDIFLASSFAIQILLAAPPPKPKPETRLKPEYSQQPWNTGPLPVPISVKFDEIRQKIAPRVAILTATPVERDMVLRHMKPTPPRRSIIQVFHNANTYFIGRLGLQSVVLSMCDMGTSGRDAALAVTTELIHEWAPEYVIMVGIAFGRDPDKQRIGDVLVADRVIAYEPERVGPSGNESRGHHPPAGPRLLNRFKNVIGWTFDHPSGGSCRVRTGPILSGEKLIDNPDFKSELFTRYPTAIGGEMEGAGLAAAADRVNCEWMMVKGICDWADGNKRNPHKDRDQDFAAAAAVNLTQHVLTQLGVL